MTVARLRYLPPLFTDADWIFDFQFFSGNVDTPAAFAGDDQASLCFTPKGTLGTAFELTTQSGKLLFSADNAVGARLQQAYVATLVAAQYSWELRRIGADGAIDALAIGDAQVAPGASDLANLQNSNWPPLGLGAPGAVQIITSGSAAQVIYPPAPPRVVVRDASLVSFDDTLAGLGATTVQSAIDEICLRLFAPQLSGDARNSGLLFLMGAI